MNIQTAKLELLQRILNTDNPSLIDMLLKLVKSEKEDFWLTLSKEEKEDILSGIKELDKGESVDYEDFLVAKCRFHYD
ncbi:MAG: hypothetical protein HOD63_02255 [Bacteroidetes bacterium]|jgi:hypothetical protein|nr:hypothetical protein [Bacteroidota bacterium]MBT5530025.1 hypothetical protein [Cytophagia bacterium]MBT4337392.1 hypothetical protein [Bacteroidota bacterium]MBT4727238.1 hypothetical protein [Bacteroidota bacterium]MBT5990973.1 hypothetical protein [Bacteroidota bacterium]